MSEYQYYEFATVGRQLTRAQMDELRGISGRADISPTRFCNTYNYGDLKERPERMLAEYFDLFVYVSNFAYCRFIVKLPKRVIGQQYLEQFFPGENSQVRTAGENWLIEFCYSDEDGYDEEWVEGEGWMSRLLSIRSELLMGDYRSLYLVWLAEQENNEACLDQPVSATEPAVPDGLDDLTASQDALCEFLRISPHLVKAAAEYKGVEETPDLGTCVERWVSNRGDTECRELLHALLVDDTGEKKAEIIRLLRQPDDQVIKEKNRRTVAELRRREAEICTDAVSRARKKEQERKEKFIEQVVAQEPLWWSRVEELFEQRGSSTVYRELVEKLRALQLVAEQKEKNNDFHNRIQRLRERYNKKKQHWREAKKVVS